MMELIGEWMSDMGGQFGKDDGSVQWLQMLVVQPCFIVRGCHGIDWLTCHDTKTDPGIGHQESLFASSRHVFITRWIGYWHLQ